MKYKIVNNSDSLDYQQFRPILSSFLKYATNRMGFNKPPSLFFVSDESNAQLPLGKTAHYDPVNMGVTVYTDQRHPKDILRSLSHELVHHKQNCDGQFDKLGEMGEGYAQNDKHLRSMEEQAYLEGNMCFRDWEDTHKKQLQESNYYFRGDKKMKLYEWKNAELATLIKEKFNIPEGEGLYKRDEEEEIEEGGLANREGDPRQRRPEASPIREEDEEEIEEKLNMVDHDGKPDTPEVPDFAADGKGDDDLKKGTVDEAEGETAQDVAARLKNIPTSFRHSVIRDFENMAEGDTEMAEHYPHVQDLAAFAKEVLSMMHDQKAMFGEDEKADTPDSLDENKVRLAVREALKRYMSKE